MGNAPLRPAAAALAAALLFGLSVPLSKALLDDAGLAPTALAGLLYLASGLGLAAWRLARREPLLGLPRSALGRTALVALVGGVAAPIALLYGLRRAEGQEASLLLALEGAFTAALAATLFREHVGRAAWGAVGLAAAAAVVLAAPWEAAADRPDPLGLLLVAGASLGWALDNNLSRSLSDRDPVQVTALKGLMAGAVGLGASVALGEGIPLSLPVLGGAAAVGVISYGLSLVLILRAFAGLGTARTMAIFAAAPAFGMAGSWALLGERPGASLGAAAALLAAGAWLLSRERHEHLHEHGEMEHEHEHVHDEHHRHEHEGGEGPEPHTHRHKHGNLVHSHPHVPDLHHRHGH